VTVPTWEVVRGRPDDAELAALAVALHLVAARRRARARRPVARPTWGHGDQFPHTGWRVGAGARVHRVGRVRGRE
jgi:hypothetical protein